MFYDEVCLVYVRNYKEMSEVWVEWIREKGVNNEVRKVMEMMVYVGFCRFLFIVLRMIRIKVYW